MVLDSMQAVVPGATVTVMSEGTGVARTTESTIDGLYSFPLLPPDVYTIEVRAAGFRAAVRTGLKLEVGQSATLDFVLEPGAVEQSITVSAEGSLLRSDSATISTVVDRQFIENLPMNGRSLQTLIALTPGVGMTKASFGEQGQFSVNGQRANANYFTIDGVSANIGVSGGLTLVQTASGSLPGLGATGGTNTLVSVDALQEFRVQTSGYAPEYGRQPGAQVTMLTRSGTNQVHGSLFEFFRNDALDATDWFANANQLPKPALRQNDFGGVLGGPVVRNRTFFFFSYEGLRLRQPQVRSTDVPSLRLRELAGSSTRPFLDAYPLPNRPEGRSGFAPFVASYTDSSYLNATSLRLDHMIGSRVTVFGRYNYAPSSSTSRLLALSNPVDNIANTRTLTTGLTAILSPTISAESRFNLSHTTGESYARLDNFGGAIPLDPQTFFPGSQDPANSFGGYFLLGGIDSNYYLGKNVANAQQQINWVNNVSWTIGSHQLKFGVDWRRIATHNSPRAYNLFARFSGVTAAVFGQTTQTVVEAQEDISVFFHNLSLFAQDTWRATSRLTLTYGLRWEINPAPRGSKQLYTFTGYDPDPRNLHVAPAGTPLYGTTWGNFEPRLGVAYQLIQKPGQETTIRGSFGLFHDLGSGIIAQAASGFPYYRQKVFLSGTNWPLPASSAVPPPFSLDPPGSSIYAAVPGLKLPLTYQWSLGVERALGTSSVLSVSYVAAAGRNLLRQDFWVNPNDDFVYAYLLTNNAFSDFESLQVQYQRRLSRGFQALVTYTWGHSIDNASNDSASHLIAAQLNPRTDRGPSDFDIRHTLSAAFTYNLPASRFRLAHSLTRDWSLDGVVSVRTATPVNVTYYADLGFGAYNFRPDWVPGAPLYINDANVAGGRRFNPDAFQTPNEFPGRQGTLGRNVLRGFGLGQLNLTVRREFPIHEQVRLQFRAEMFNVLNHPSFGDPSGMLGSPQFGFATQMLGRSLGQGGVNGGLNPLYQVGGPRSVQLALRLVL